MDSYPVFERCSVCAKPAKYVLVTSSEWQVFMCNEHARSKFPGHFHKSECKQCHEIKQLSYIWEHPRIAGTNLTDYFTDQICEKCAMLIKLRGAFGENIDKIKKLP